MYILSEKNNGTIFDGRYTLELEKTTDHLAVKSCSFPRP